MFHNYDPGRVIVTFRGILIQGFADGTFVNAERTEDAFAKVVGASGDVTRVRSRDRSGEVTLTLQAASPTNDLLSAVAQIDESTGLGYGPLLIKDLNGNTLLLAEQAWIRKAPAVEFGTDASNREWVFDCAALDMTVGGAVV